MDRRRARWGRNLLAAAVRDPSAVTAELSGHLASVSKSGIVQ